MPEPLPVSVLILTLDEAANLPRCLAALQWTDDVVVLDSGSRDGTQAIAERAGARLFQRPFDNFANQRNHALDTVTFKYDWILHLDADEVVTPGLREELARRPGTETFDAYRLPSRLMFMDRWLRYCGDYPTYQVRLGRRDKLRFVQVGHGQREALAPAQIGTFESPYDHHSFSKGLDDWFARHNRYSSDEARRMVELVGEEGTESWRALFTGDRTSRRRVLKDLTARAPFRGTLRFLYLYVLRGGFRDGLAGLRYCQMMAVYEQMIAIKMAALRSGRDV